MIDVNKELSKYDIEIGLNTTNKEIKINNFVLGYTNEMEISINNLIYNIYLSILKTENLNFDYTIKYLIRKYNLSLNKNNLNFSYIIKIYKNKKSYTTLPKYSYFPESGNKLRKLVNKLIEIRGDNCSLNDIDVSKIKTLNSLFYGSKFNGDISKWDVSNVDSMTNMFYNSQFNGDISEWDVSNVISLNSAFAFSKFNGDITKWNVGKIRMYKSIFHNSPLEDNKPKWYKGR